MYHPRLQEREYVRKTHRCFIPRGHVEVLDVLYDAGEWDVSVARINYRDELNQPFSECTGIRWNGNLDEGSKGMPLSRDIPCGL